MIKSQSKNQRSLYMKKILNISIVAALAVSPMLAFAEGESYQGGSATSLTGNDANIPFALSADASNDGTNVVTASYVKGAYNDLTRKINTVAAAAGTDATTKITQAAGNGLAGNNGVLSVNVASAGGLAITDDALNVVTDGTTIVKDETNGTLSVGAIAESQVTGLQTDLNNKQGILTNNDATENADTSINTTVLTTVGATGTNNSLVTEKAVRDAITAATTTANMVTTTGTQTLTNKTIDVDSNTVSNIEVDNFKSTAIVTSTPGIAAATADASDTALPTEKAVRSAITSATSGMVTETSLSGGTLAVSANTLQVGGKAVATQSGVKSTIAASTVTIPVLATWGDTQTSNGSTLSITAPANYTDPS